MGGIFSFLNTFFVGSLLMSVVLVVMMLFQFRQRINHLQEKSETMLQIINSIVEKMNIKEIELSGNSGGGQNSVEEISPLVTMQQIEPQTFQGFTEIENLKQQDSEGEDDDESDDESGEEVSENEDEEQSYDEDEDESEDEEEDEEKSELEQVDIVAVDEISQVTDMDVTKDVQEEQDLSLEDDENEDDEEEGNTEDDNSLAKMTVAQLKDAVRERGLASNPSKLRKSELIELLTN